MKKKHLWILKIQKCLLMNKIVLCILLCVGCIGVNGQVALSTEDAILKTLDNNFNIQIAENDVLIAENNTEKSLFGYNPTLDASLGFNADINNSTTNFNSGESIVTGYGLAYGGGAAVSAGYNIIDPNRSLNLKQAEELVALSDLQRQLAIQNNVAQVLSAYYDASRAYANIDILENVLELSQNRFERLDVQNQYGQSSRLDLLNAQVDIDRDSINIANAKLVYDNSIRTLNNLMGVDVSELYALDTTITYDITRTLSDYIASALEDNIEMKLIDQNQSITELNYDLIKASKKPVLGANATYNYNVNVSAPGSFFQSSRSNGLGLGLTLLYNIYDGGVRKNQKENTKLSIESQLIQRDQFVNNLKAQMTNVWYQFQNALAIIKAEQSNVLTTVVNFQRTNEEFKTGRVTSIEYRQAQINLLTAENSLLNARYDAKLLEVQLLLLSGDVLNI